MVDNLNLAVKALKELFPTDDWDWAQKWAELAAEGHQEKIDAYTGKYACSARWYTIRMFEAYRKDDLEQADEIASGFISEADARKDPIAWASEFLEEGEEKHYPFFTLLPGAERYGSKIGQNILETVIDLQDGTVAVISMETYPRSTPWVIRRCRADQLGRLFSPPLYW